MSSLAREAAARCSPAVSFGVAQALTSYCLPCLLLSSVQLSIISVPFFSGSGLAYHTCLLARRLLSPTCVDVLYVSSGF